MMRVLLLCLTLIAAPVWALSPSEMLSDPALEERARALDHDLRCVVCQSESVASSNASWAEDARRTVRELVAEGATDEEVRDFFVARYGEFVLMAPRADGSTLLLWAAGPIMVILAGLIGVSYVRGREKAQAPHEEELSAEEAARLQEILKE